MKKRPPGFFLSDLQTSFLQCSQGCDIRLKAKKHFRQGYLDLLRKTSNIGAIFGGKTRQGDNERNRRFVAVWLQ